MSAALVDHPDDSQHIALQGVEKQVPAIGHRTDFRVQRSPDPTLLRVLGQIDDRLPHSDQKRSRPGRAPGFGSPVFDLANIRRGSDGKYDAQDQVSSTPNNSSQSTVASGLAIRSSISFFSA